MIILLMWEEGRLTLYGALVVVSVFVVLLCRDLTTAASRVKIKCN